MSRAAWGFAMVAGIVGAFVLLSFWYHPLGLDALEPAMQTGFWLLPFAAGLIAGFVTARPGLAVLSGAASVIGVVVGWLLTTAFDDRQLGDFFWLAWFVIAFITAVGHLLGSAVGQRFRSPVTGAPR